MQHAPARSMIIAIPHGRRSQGSIHGALIAARADTFAERHEANASVDDLGAMSDSNVDDDSQVGQVSPSILGHSRRGPSMISRFVAGALLAAAVLFGVGCAQKQAEPPSPQDDAAARAAAAATAAKIADEKQIAEDAYIYGYSLITTEVTRVQMSNVSKADETHAPMGQFINVRRYPPGELPRRVGAQRRHALLAGLARPRQGADGVQPSRHGQALLSCFRCTACGCR